MKIRPYYNRLALISEGSKKITYDDLIVNADRIIRIISRRCLVFVIAENCADFIAGYVGFMRAKCVVALLGESTTAAQLNYLLAQYKPSYVYLPSFQSQLVTSSVTSHSFDSYILHQTEHIVDYPIFEDLALLVTTSGTTGSKKFVRQTYENIAHNSNAIGAYLNIQETDRPITTMPPNYVYGLSIINSHLVKGATIIVNNYSFLQKEFWRSLQVYRATTFGGVPYFYEMLLKLNIRNRSLSNIRYLTQAGGKLSDLAHSELVDICIKKNIRFYAMYGQTEATSRISYLPWDPGRSPIGSIGIAIPGGELWLEDERGKPIGEHNTKGELVYKGPNVALGYAEGVEDLQKGDENNGVLHTGDLALRDRKGFFFVVGRKSRFLKIHGTRINLDEVENQLIKAGFECACAGTDDKLKIYFTCHESDTKITNYIEKIIGINKNLFSTIFLTKIPRNNAGKPSYSKLS